MKVSLNWLKEYVELPESIDLSTLAYDLTMSTVEVEGVTDTASKFDKMVIGEIQEVTPHPNADKLRICKVDIGNGTSREIVCGGSNLQKGMKVAVALPGSMVRWHGEGEPVEIKDTKVRDVHSFGMICLSSEIGLADLFPLEEETAILDLSEFDSKPGTSLAVALGLNDFIIEIDNKSLTNRPDLWGHYGIARELAAIYNVPFREIEATTPPAADELTVEIQDTENCPRYIGTQIEGVDTRKTPFNIRRRLWSVGAHPINGLVDVTNYVMLATGQPTHAFDADNISGHITVRPANESEKLILLDGRKLSLSGKDLVIADDEKAVALAGVMGGVNDSVSPTTSKVILEIANFDPLSVRHTMMRYDARTEAATRYEKAIDPERCDVTYSLAMKMFNELYPGMTITRYSDNYPTRHKNKEIDVDLAWLERNLGKHIPKKEIADMLGRLGFSTSFKGNDMHVIVPSWRSTGDVSIPSDIFEEVVRIHGYDKFKPTDIKVSLSGPVNQVEIDVQRKAKEYLAFRCGMQEVFTYPWVDLACLKATSSNLDGMLSLSAPPSPNEKYLRASLVPNLCKAVGDNLRYFREFSLFEVAQVFSGTAFSNEYDAQERLPLVRKQLAGAITGDYKGIETLFRRAKGIVENMPSYVHSEPLSFEKREKPFWADDVVWVNIVHADETKGYIALLSKKAALECGIKNNAVMLFESDMDALRPYPSRTNTYERVSDYPVIDYDISLLFDSVVAWENIYACIMETKGNNPLLQDARFLEEYKGENIPKGQKSVSIRLRIGSNSRTLKTKEAEDCANAVVGNLHKKFGANLRS